MIFVIWMRSLVVDHLYVAGGMFNRGHYLDLFLDWLVSKYRNTTLTKAVSESMSCTGNVTRFWLGIIIFGSVMLLVFVGPLIIVRLTLELS